MDYNTESVGLCLCFCFFTYPHYVYFMCISNFLKGGLIITIAIMSYLEIDEMISFKFPITIGIFCLGYSLIYHRLCAHIGIMFKFGITPQKVSTEGR